MKVRMTMDTIYQCMMSLVLPERGSGGYEEPGVLQFTDQTQLSNSTTTTATSRKP